MNQEDLFNVAMQRKGRVIEAVGKETISSNGVNGDSEKPQETDDIIRGISILNVRERMEKLRDDVVNHLGDQIDDMVSDVIEGLEATNKLEGSSSRRIDETEKLYFDKRKPSTTAGGLLEKQFLRRNSVLTDLYEIKHFKTIYNIFLVILIILSINTVIYDMLSTGSTNVGLNLIMRGFAKFSIVIEIWLGMFASTVGVYVAFNYWASERIKIQPKSFKLKIWDYIWVQLFIIYQIALITIPAKALVSYDLPPISRLVVLAEQIRMVMKIHAFVRSATPIVRSHKLHSEDEKNFVFPDFSKFLYFMFAPTLIYRDSYPRTKEIRWKVVLWHLTEVVLVTFNMAFIFERNLIPPFEEFGKHPIDTRSLILTVCGTSLPGILVFLSGFYLLLHAWMNAAAEVMRFGDRLFYKDWWNSTTYANYYRQWNVVVHDWLYTYIYKDMYNIITSGNRFVSTFAVFFVSSIFHEYIIAFTFGFFLPVMFLMFGVIGFLLIFLVRTSHATGNLFLWFSLCTGSGLMISFYSIEYFARVNCPPQKDMIHDLFLPRSFYCF